MPRSVSDVRRAHAATPGQLMSGGRGRTRWLLLGVALFYPSSRRSSSRTVVSRSMASVSISVLGIGRGASVITSLW